jgi:imidazole glycerol phosphate synthase glutamine amidotransferase subunit
MNNQLRIIARLDVKSDNVIKGVNFEGLRVIGSPWELALKYVEQGADEILYLDTVASLYGRSNLFDVIKRTAEHVNIPIIAGGGIRSLEDIDNLLKAGADKVAINTYAVNNPNFIDLAVKKYGSQCIVASINAKKNKDGKWVAWTDNAREPTKKDVFEWALELQSLNVGEILITSIDNDGTLKGLNSEITQKIAPFLKVPFIFGGGYSPLEGLEFLLDYDVNGIVVGSALHYDKVKIKEIKDELSEIGIETRSELPITLTKFNKSSNKNVSIIDYGVGNTFGLIQSLKKIGVKANIIRSAIEISNAERIILPGVGAFSFAINKLKELELIESINSFVNNGKPILGICLGAQLLLDESYEDGTNKGLSLIPGVASLIDNKAKCKVPHVGWSAICKTKTYGENCELASKINDGGKAYFVHSYEMKVPDKHVMMTTNYQGNEINAFIKKNNIYGFQFHPEKSGNFGLNILKIFSEL